MMTTGKKQPDEVVQLQPGPPQVRSEPWTKVTCCLMDRHVAYLDGMSVLIRLRHHKPRGRSEILRALVEFMEQSAIDFSRFASSEEMTTFLTDYFRKLLNQGRLQLLLESTLFHPPQTVMQTPAEEDQAAP